MIVVETLNMVFINAVIRKAFHEFILISCLFICFEQ